MCRKIARWLSERPLASQQGTLLYKSSTDIVEKLEEISSERQNRQDRNCTGQSSSGGVVHAGCPGCRNTRPRRGQNSGSRSICGSIHRSSGPSRHAPGSHARSTPNPPSACRRPALAPAFDQLFDPRRVALPEFLPLFVLSHLFGTHGASVQARQPVASRIDDQRPESS